MKNKIHFFLALGVFTLILITLSTKGVSAQQSCGKDYLTVHFGSNNKKNIKWEVGFRYLSKFRTEDITHKTWKVDVDLSFSGCDFTYCSGGITDLGSIATIGPLDGKRPYGIQWGTACIDPQEPAAQLDPSKTGHSCNYWFTTGYVNVTANNSYLSDAAENAYNGGIIRFTGYSDTSNCPRAPRYEIDGRVFVDDNRDGNRDDGERFYQGAIIRKTGDGNPETDTTGNNGYYRFYNLPSGNNYKVDFTNKPNGYVFTKPGTGDWTGINLPPNRTFNFGIAPDRGAIGGRVYIDKNGDNNPDPGEGYSGASVFKDKGTNNQEKRTSDPDYNFGGLTGGSTHDIKLEDFPAARLNVEGDNPKRNVRVPNSNANFRLNFQKYAIKGHVYWDPDGNGISTTPYSKTVALTVVGEGRNDTTNDNGAYAINGNPTDLTPDGKKYTLRLTNQRDGDIVEGGRDRPVTIKDKDEVEDFFLTRNAIPTYSLSGGLFIDTDPVGQRNGEGYTTPFSPEHIEVNGRRLNTANFPGSSFDGNGFYVPGLSAGVYDVEFPLPIRRNNYVVSFHPGRYRVTVGPNGANLDFGISQTIQQVYWFQGVGGYMRDDHSGSVTIPAGKYFSLKGSEDTPNLPSLASPGVVFNFNINGGVSSKGWKVANSTYRSGVIKTSFDYITDALKKGKANQYNLFGRDQQCGGGVSPNCFLDNPPGGYFYTNNRDVVIKKATFRDNSKYIFLIDGNLTIDIGATPWNIPNGTTAIFVVKGNITVNSNVTHLEGIFSADGDFRVNSKSPAADSQLVIEGSVIANALRNSANTKPFDNQRDLKDSNDDTPSVKIIYRPDFVLNAPNIVRYSNYNFQEVPPSGQ